MLRICISGLTGSGKTSLGSELASDLGVMHITKAQTKSYSIFKSDKNKLSKNSREIETANEKYAKDFDSEIAKLASTHDCIVSTWLGPWVVKNATLRVWLDASLDERVRRKARQKKITISEARRYVMSKDRNTIDSFKKLYNIDIMDHAIFDIAVNTERLSRKDIISVISLLSAEKDRIMFK
jgi:predicted cytidylate kinase